MPTGDGPVRRLRRKTRVSVGATVLAHQVPRGSRLLSGVPARSPSRGPCVDICNILRSFSGTDVIATVASFLDIRALGQFLRLEKHVCDEDGLWRVLLRRVSHSVSALSVRSARSSVSRMMCRPYGIWPGGARASYLRLSNYRWCLDLCYREEQMFSAVVPVVTPRVENQGDFRSLFRSDFAGRQRIANLLPVHHLPLHVLELLDNAWNRTTDPLGWSRDLQLLQEFRGSKLTCSLWLFDLDSRGVLAGIRRDAHWGSGSRLFRFYIPEIFQCVRVDWDFDPAPDGTPYRVGRVLEIWVPFECSHSVEGTYDLSCSVEVFVADGTVYPEDRLTWEVLGGWSPGEDPALEWERRRADTRDLMCALGGCTQRSAVPDVEV